MTFSGTWHVVDGDAQGHDQRSLVSGPYYTLTLHNSEQDHTSIGMGVYMVRKLFALLQT